MKTDVLIIGAGASGVMCAIEAAKRGRSVIVIDHNDRPLKKLLVSGGGRCNFTNRRMSADHFISSNPHFVRSALARYKPEDFIAFLDSHCVKYHEEDSGQMFCDSSSADVAQALMDECDAVGVKVQTGMAVRSVETGDGRFIVRTDRGECSSSSLVVATGGLSYAALGASDIGYKIAKQFSISLIETRPALAPFVFGEKARKFVSNLSGISVTARVSCEKKYFDGDILFTHKGLSGPAILQISSFWDPKDELVIDILPGVNIASILEKRHVEKNRMELKNLLSRYLPRRLAEAWCDEFETSRPVAECSAKALRKFAEKLHRWVVVPSKLEGYSTAEVTRGGVDTRAVSSKTMEAALKPGLYFTGEVLDVTGELGGYNLHWAWASGAAAGRSV